MTDSPLQPPLDAVIEALDGLGLRYAVVGALSVSAMVGGLAGIARNRRHLSTPATRGLALVQSKRSKIQARAGRNRHLHARVGDWMLVAKSLRFAQNTVTDMVYGRTPISASMAFRAARFLGASIDDLLAGRFTPPLTCPYCKQPVPS